MIDAMSKLYLNTSLFILLALHTNMQPLTFGILLALIAMIGWGFGDFLIQRSTRKFGNWETLFIITFSGAIVLLPFVFSQLITLAETRTFCILLGASVVILFGALYEFEGFRQGKLSVIEPLLSLEVPVSIVLALFVLGEVLTGMQYGLIALLLLGLVLVSLEKAHVSRKAWLEKGVIIAAAGALLMGVANFGVGFAARESSPLMINWFMSVFLAVVSYTKLRVHGKHRALWQNCWRYRTFLAKMCILDNAAWIAFAYAMVLAPIGIAVALSESYIIIGVILGVYINKDKLKAHQKVGLLLGLASAIVLATSV